MPSHEYMEPDLHIQLDEHQDRKLWTARPAGCSHEQEGADAGPAPQFVSEVGTRLPSKAQFDVAVCGGTLGIFLAAALAKRGLKVVLLERGPLVGRAQEWNISRKEMVELVEVRRRVLRLSACSQERVASCVQHAASHGQQCCTSERQRPPFTALQTLCVQCGKSCSGS